MKKVTTIFITIIICSFLAVNFLLKPNQLNYISNSTINGLAMMRAMASETISYQDAIVNEKPTLIEFYADWCTTCQSMSPILSSLKEKHADQVNFVMVNIDRPENQSLVDEYQVAGVPQWNFLDNQGEPIDRLVGKLPESILESSLKAMSI